jgi:hypothetical protein
MVLAIILMPFAAAGESTRLLFGRCLRLTWWSTTMLIPLGIGWLLDPLVRRLLELPDEWLPVDYAALSLFAVWWLFVFLRSGYRYAGPPTGPAWDVRRSCCEGCGYILADIPVSTNCPECGRPVAESMPERRQAPAFARAVTFAQANRMFWTTLRKLVFDKSFFARLAVHRDQARDRTFFIGACSLMAIVTSLTICVPWFLFDETLIGHPLVDAVVVACACLLGPVLLAGLAAATAAVLGHRTPQSAAVVSFYWAIGPLLLACCLLLCLASLALSMAAFEEWANAPARALACIVAAGIATVGLLLALAGARCLLRAFPHTRRANA